MRLFWEHCRAFPGEINLTAEWETGLEEVLGYAKEMEGKYVYYGLSKFARDKPSFPTFLQLARAIKREALVAIIGGHIK